MANRSSRPALRPVESIVVPDARHGRLLVLRDTQGVSDSHAAIPPELIPIVARFNGVATCEQIAREASRELGGDVPVDLVVKLAEELDRGLFLEGPTFRQALARIEREFAKSPVRAASHAGGAYAGEAPALRRYIEDQCLGVANAANAAAGAKANAHARLTALIAPHIDPWRGAKGYGHAYGVLKRALARQPEVDTFILFGTSHAPMRQPFALCRKTFATPLGDMHADTEAVDAIAEAVPFDVYADQFNHKREHSLEFQVVFVRHVLAELGRTAKIVPVLAGLGEHQARRSDPAKDAAVERFLASIRTIVDARPGRAVIIAGADLAHVGPRFGDARPSASALHALDAADRQSLTHASAADPRAFWQDVAKDLETRRVCGLAPIYSLLRTLPHAESGRGSEGELLHYEQTVDEDDGSVVSHAAVAFFEEPRAAVPPAS